MTRFAFFIQAAAFALALALPVSALAADDPVVARVNGFEFHKSDVMKQMSQLPPQAQSAPVEQIYPLMIERMVDSKLVADQGRAEKLDQSPEYKERTAAASERILTDITLRSKIKPMVTDDKIRARYDAVVAKEKAKPAEEEVRARHILVKTEAEAKDIIAQLNKGADFNKLAAEKSTDKGSAAKGGDLDYFTKGAMVPEFANAAFAMKKGEISKVPVKTDFGYHVIKLEDRRMAKPPEPPAFAAVKPQIEAALADEMAQSYVDDLKKKSKVEILNLDGTPMKIPAVGTPPAAAAPAAPATVPGPAK